MSIHTVICKHCKQPFTVETKNGGRLPDYCDEPECREAWEANAFIVKKRYVKKRKAVRSTGKIPPHDETTLRATIWTEHHKGTCDKCKLSGAVNRFNVCIWCYKHINDYDLAGVDDMFLSFERVRASELMQYPGPYENVYPD